MITFCPSTTGKTKNTNGLRNRMFTIGPKDELRYLLLDSLEDAWLFKYFIGRPGRILLGLTSYISPRLWGVRVWGWSNQAKLLKR